MKKIAVFGSRKIDENDAKLILYDLMKKENWYITSGNIDGVAKCAREVAGQKGIKITLYNYESGVGYLSALSDIRTKNQNMVKECEEAIVLWNGTSKGTEREIAMLDEANKPYQLFRLAEDEDIFNFNIDDII